MATSNRAELRARLEENLNGYVICDYITRKDMRDYLKDFDQWVKTAKNGESYYFDGCPYKYEVYTKR